MRYRTILYLAFVAAVLGYLLHILEKREREDLAERLQPSVLFADFDPAAIDVITIAREDGGMTLERRDREWRIAEPFVDRADAERVNALVAYAGGLRVRETLTREHWGDRGLSPRHFGLETPRNTVRFAGASAEFLLWLGIESPLDDGLFVRAGADAEIKLIDRGLLERLPRHPEDMRERVFMHGSAADVARLEIKPYAGIFLRLERGGDGRWTVRQPFEARTERGVVRERLEMLFDTRIIRFLPGTAGAVLAPYGLEPGEAALQVSVWKNGADTPEEFYLGNATGEDAGSVYARRGGGGGIFTVPRALRDSLRMTPEDVRDRTVFFADPWQANRFELRDRDRSVTLELRETGWYVADPVDWKADDETAIETVIKMRELRAEGFVTGAVTNPAAFGLDRPVLGMALWSGAGGAVKERIAIGAPAGERAYYARRAGEDGVFALSAAGLERLLIGRNEAGIPMTDPLVYRDRSVLAVSPGTVWRIELRRGESHQVVERDSAGEWRALHPEGGQADAGGIRELLETVADLRALRIEQRGIENPEVFGFDRPGLILTLGLMDAEGISKTVIGGFRSRTDGIFTMVQGSDLVFAVDRAIIEKLGKGVVVPSRRDAQP